MDNHTVTELLLDIVGVDVNVPDALRTLYSQLQLPGHSEDCLCTVPFTLWKGAQPGPSDYLIGAPGSFSAPHFVSTEHIAPVVTICLSLPAYCHAIVCAHATAVLTCVMQALN